MTAALPLLRPMTPADVDAASDALLRNDWGEDLLGAHYASEHPG